MTSAKSRPTTYTKAWQGLPHPQADNAIRDIAHRISREFHNILDANDLIQEFHIFLMTKPSHAGNWFWDDDGTERFGWKSFKRDTAAVMARACREARHAAGYEAEDDAFYSKNSLEQLLPFVFHTTVLATINEQHEVKAPVDAAKGGNHLASVMDVRIAYEKVIVNGSQWDQVLRALFHNGMNNTEAAQYLHLTPSVVGKHKARATEALLQKLNGTMPLPSHDGPGSRKAQSNSAAIAKTRNQE